MGGKGWAAGAGCVGGYGRAQPTCTLAPARPTRRTSSKPRACSWIMSSVDRAPSLCSARCRVEGRRGSSFGRLTRTRLPMLRPPPEMCRGRSAGGTLTACLAQGVESEGRHERGRAAGWEADGRSAAGEVHWLVPPPPGVTCGPSLRPPLAPFPPLPPPLPFLSSLTTPAGPVRRRACAHLRRRRPPPAGRPRCARPARCRPQPGRCPRWVGREAWWREAGGRAGDGRLAPPPPSPRHPSRPPLARPPAHAPANPPFHLPSSRSSRPPPP